MRERSYYSDGTLAKPIALRKRAMRAALNHTEWCPRKRTGKLTTCRCNLAKVWRAAHAQHVAFAKAAAFKHYETDFDPETLRGLAICGAWRLHREGVDPRSHHPANYTTSISSVTCPECAPLIAARLATIEAEEI